MNSPEHSQGNLQGDLQDDLQDNLQGNPQDILQEQLQDCLRPSRFIDSDNCDIVALADSLTHSAQDELEKAVALYYCARDEIRYNPYALAVTPEAFRASTTLAAGEGWCVPKALLLAALARAAGIPARVGFADVRNHLSTQRMREAMQTDIFYFHGYTSLYLQERWVKATPAFNIELCNKFGLHPLEFDGLQDSLYHEFDLAGNKHMEYLNDRGEYLDLPFDDMIAVFKLHYDNMLPSEGRATPDKADWEADVEREVGSG